MVSSHKISAITAVLAVTFLASLTCIQAAPAKLKVPANIIKGATLTTGRAFYATNLPEDSLAGIKLGRKAQEVLAKWGNPTKISIATTSTAYEANDAVAPTGPSMMGFGANMLPGLMGAQPQAQPQQTTGTVTVHAQEEVTWIYELQRGITLEFIITDGLVTQITVGGVGPWGLSKTRTGIQLGDTYKLVLWVCGYPESQNYVGKFLRVSYVNKSRALYTFLDKKLVGVTIAMVPSDLQ